MSDERVLDNGGPFWWRDVTVPSVLPCVETRWTAGTRYTRTWDADGTYVDRVYPGKFLQSTRPR